MFRRRRRRRKTKTKDEDERRSKKNSRKKKVNFQNKCVSSQKHRMRKEEGAAVDSSAILPYLSSVGSFVRAGRAAFFHGNLQTFSGKAPLTTTNVLPSTRNETPAIFRLKLIDSPKQMRYKYM